MKQPKAAQVGCFLPYNLHNTPSPFSTARCPRLISLTVRHLSSRQRRLHPRSQTCTYPANAMVIRSSAIKILTASSTPCCPLYCPNHQFLLITQISFFQTYCKSPYRHSTHEHKISTQCQCFENITTPSYTTIECDRNLAFGNGSTISKAIKCCRDTLIMVSKFNMKTDSA